MARIRCYPLEGRIWYPYPYIKTRSYLERSQVQNGRHHLFPGLIWTAYSIGRSFCLCEDLRLLPRPTSFGATVPFPSPASPSLRRRRQRWTVRQRTVSAHRRRLLLQDVATSGSPTSAATAPTPPSRLLSKLLLLSFLARQPNP